MTAPADPPTEPERDREPPPVRFGADGLIPAVIQEASTNAVLMVGFMNEEALRLTRTTGKVHFWSRSRRKLWRKGETSGHEQLVDVVYVNCEQNSLLVTVRQVGAACHDGYPTCYYRRLEPDGGLMVVAERVFDPAVVCSSRPDRPSAGADGEARELESATRVQFGAYAYLRDNDLAAVSGTSARLRSAEDTVAERLADELRELAGALDGSHRHRDLAGDVLLEGGQILYWAILASLRAGGSWERLRPDRALLTADPDLSGAASVAMLRAEADRWSADRSGGSDVDARCHATLALVGQACRVAGVDPRSVVEADLSELRAKAYLDPYFAGGAS